MRFLAIALGAVIAAAVACYSPTLADCQFSCGTGNACPAGQSCDTTIGMCRSNGGSGACPGSGGPDAPGACPTISIAMCSAPVAFAGSDCATTCTPTVLRTWSASDMECTNAMPAGWRLAFLNTLARLENAPAAGSGMWVGASGTGSAGTFRWSDTSVVALEEWDAGYPTPVTSGTSCVYAASTGSGNRLRNADCTAPLRPFICDHP